MVLDRKLFNVLILSCGFMIIFSALYTTFNIEKTVLDIITKENKNLTVGDGYTSMSITYLTFAIFLWIAPSFILLTSARMSIIIGSIFYVFYIFTFLWPQKYLLYTSSAFSGFGAALLWTGQGKYLIDNSDSSTLSRNTSIFWIFYTFSFFGGNLFVYCFFTDTNFEAKTRKQIFITLSILTLIATIILIALGNELPEKVTFEKENAVFEAEKLKNVVAELVEEVQLPEKPLGLARKAIKDAFLLLITPQMMLLSLTALYTGLTLTFYSGVYSSSVGFVVKMGGSREKLVSLTGVFIGIGECVGGLVLGTIIPKLKIRPGMRIVCFGFLIQVVAFITILLNLPNNAPFKDTEDIGFITPSPRLSLLGGFLMGVGDACFNTQMYYLIGKLYEKQSHSAFAIFNFCLSCSSAISFYYSNYFGLYIQLGILFVMGVLGCVTYSIVDLKNTVRT